MFNNHTLVGKVPEDEVNIPSADWIDSFLESSLQIDTGMKMPGLVASPVISVAPAETSPQQTEAFPVRIVEGREKFIANES